MQRQFQDAVIRVVPDFAFPVDSPEGLVGPATGPDHEFADPALRVGPILRVLGSEAFVGVIVPREDEIRVGVVEHLPEVPHV